MEDVEDAGAYVMATFFDRLADYYRNVAAVLRGEADTASIFPNSTDKGTSREQVYIDFLRSHAPSKCNVFAGGFLFHMDGRESRQLDAIVTTDTAPRFDFHNKNNSGKSFAPVEGTLGVVSVKGTSKNRSVGTLLAMLGGVSWVRHGLAGAVSAVPAS